MAGIYLKEDDFALYAKRNSLSWGRAVQKGGRKPTFYYFSSSEQELYRKVGFIQYSEYADCCMNHFSYKRFDNYEDEIMIWRLLGRPLNYVFNSDPPDEYFDSINEHNKKVKEDKMCLKNQGFSIADTIAFLSECEYKMEKHEVLQLKNAMYCAVEWAASHCCKLY